MELTAPATLIVLFIGAVLWLEATLRITASVERRMQRRIGLVGLAVIALLWPAVLTVAVIAAIARQPRSWDGGPDEPDT